MTTWLIEREDPPYSGTLTVDEDGTATVQVEGGEPIDATLGAYGIRLVDHLDTVLENHRDQGFTVTEVKA